MAAERWRRRPDGSNWGVFGDDDEIGRINLITPEVVRRAIAEVVDGERFCLSLPLDRPGRSPHPSRHPPRRFATSRDGRQNFNHPMASIDPDYTDVVCDDAVVLHTQFSTQWDALCHVGSMFDADGDGEPEVVYYNGWRGGEHILGARETSDGERTFAFEGCNATALGIDKLAETGVQGRGVLIDLHAHFGRSARKVTYADLERVLREDRVTVEPGDIVCLYTGFADMVLEMGEDTDVDRLMGACAALDGRDPELLGWITDTEIAALAADNYGVEAFPSEPGHGKHAMAPLHEHCLFKLGVPLGELWYLAELARYLRDRGRSRFLLTAPPLRLPGAVGSPVTPVATV